MPEHALDQGPVTGIWTPLGRIQKLVIWLLFWAIVAFISAINYYYLRWVADISMPLSFSQTVMSKTILWYFFGLLTLIILRIGRAIPFQRATLWSWFAKHLVISSLVVFAYTLLYTLTVMPIYGARISTMSIPPWFYDIARMHLSYYFLAYWLIIGGDHALDYYRKVRERDHQLSQARLTLLRSQLQPHFLFNSMHMILSLIETDPHAAKDMLEKLYLRNQDSCIYEVIGQAEIQGSMPRWILFNEKLGTRRIATETELLRQIRWSPVGKADKFNQPARTDRQAPPSLLKAA